MTVRIEQRDHRPWRGLDDQEHCYCPSGGVVDVVRQPYGVFCQGCGYRIGNAEKGSHE